MSFLDGISKNFGDFASSVVQVAALAFIAKQISSNTTPANQVNTTPASVTITGTPVQLQPSSENKIPVLYGASFFSGIITDAVMTNTNQTMYYCITLSEKTGQVYSTNTASDYTFQDLYWNNQRIIFKDDGITVDYTEDNNGLIDRSLNNSVKIYCYKGNSSSPVIPAGYTNTVTSNAYSIMPGWSQTTHLMDDLIFAIVRVDYDNSKGVTSLGTILFHIQNSLYKPGDVLYDYMTNSRYGAGIDPSQVLTQ